jgi:hypothetical protein
MNVTVHSNGTEELYVKPVCQQCSMICKQCFGPRENECLDCAAGFDITKNYTCVRKAYASDQDQSHFYLFTIAVLACLAPVAIFLCIFGFLQARDNYYLCFRRKLRYIDLTTSYSGIKLEQSLLDGEETDDDDDQEEEAKLRMSSPRKQEKIRREEGDGESEPLTNGYTSPSH